MPHRYKVELTLYDEKGQQVDTASHEEDYADDAQAKAEFKKKEAAARDAGHRPR